MDSGRRPRLCHMVKWKNYEGYGFNLHAEKHKTGHYIGNIEEDSPASHAGLLQGDRVIEVNGKSVVNYTHAQVVNAIKENPNETKLLVVDPLTDTYFEEENIPLNGELKNILYIKGDPPANRLQNLSPLSHKSETSVATANRTAGTPQTSPIKGSPAVSHSSPRSTTPATSNGGDRAELRLCQLVERPDFNGYGFNLHYEQGAPDPLCTHYIGKVDPGSPAQAGGLRRGDVLVEINGTPVSQLTHDQVVDVIKSDPDRVTMLVADREAMNLFKMMNTIPSGHWENIVTSPTPLTPNPSSPSTAAHSTHNSPSLSTTAHGTSRYMGDAQPSPTSSKSPETIPVPTVVGNKEPCSDLPLVKLCHLSKSPNFEGYGFNLHAGKNGVGHYIGHIDAGSPADVAGLVDGDRIVEANGENVEKMDHKLVVQKIRADPDQASLLVVGERADEWFTAHPGAGPITPRWDNLEEYRTPLQVSASSLPLKSASSRDRDGVGIVVPLNVAAQRTPDWKRGSGAGRAATTLEEQTRDGVERLPIGSGGRYTGGTEDVAPTLESSALGGAGVLTYDTFADRKAREVITTSRSEMTTDNGIPKASPSRIAPKSPGNLVLHPHRGSVPPVLPTHLYKLYSWSKSPNTPDYGLELCERPDIADGATFVRDVRMGSPADKVGMRSDTLILEVNDAPIFGKSASEVQKRIDESYPEVKLLVHDPAPATLGGGNAPTLAHKITSLPKYIEGSRSDPLASSPNHSDRAEFSMGDSNKAIGSNGNVRSNVNGNESSIRTPTQGSDSWNLSASEMRAKIAMDSKKKKDQKLDNRPLKEKYDLLQKM